MNERTNHTITAGLAVRSTVRSILTRLELNGNVTRFAEVKHWLSSDFHIKGADRHARGQLQTFENLVNGPAVVRGTHA